MKVSEQYVLAVLFIMLYKVVLLSNLWIKLSSMTSSESYLAVRSCGAVYYAIQGCSNFQICG